MAKKITIFLIFVLVGLATFLAGYLFSHRQLAENSDQQALAGNSLISRFNKTTEKHGQPAGVFSVSDEEADFPIISGDGKTLIYYIPQSGEIKSVVFKDLSASSIPIAKIQGNAQKISWASNRTLVATYQNGAIYYDLDSGYSKKLDLTVKGPVLSKSGDRLAYDFQDQGNGSGEIRVADPKIETSKKIMSVGAEDYQISWLDDGNLSLLKSPSPKNPTYWLFILNTEKGWLSKILSDKNDLQILWSPNGKKLIYSYSDRSTQENALSLLDAPTGQETSLNVKTSASKCVWSIDNNTVYCASADSFIALDTSSPKTSPKEIFSSSLSNIRLAAASATDLLLSSAEDYLIFKNSQDKKIYGLRISQ